MSTVDLTSLPAPAVLEELDFEDAYQESRANFLTAMGSGYSAPLESDPVIKLLEVNAYDRLRDRARVNDAAKATFLAYAVGTDLDQLAANCNEKRLVVVAADPSAVPPVAEVKESDDSLRNRCQLAFDKLTTAGPRAAYKAHARGAHGQVADVTADSPAPCEALITILSTQGEGVPSGEVLAAVRAALSDEDVRPLGDLVTVQAATIVRYKVQAVLYLYPGPEAELIRSAAVAALTAYISDQRRLGRDIRRSALFAALHVSGVQRVELASPAADLVLTNAQAGYCTEAVVTVGGYDE